MALTTRDLVLRGARVPAELLEASSADGVIYAASLTALRQFQATLERRFLPPGPIEEELPPLPPLPRRNPNAKSARR